MSRTLVTSAALLAGAVIAAWLGHFLLFRILGRLARRLEHPLGDALVTEERRPARALLPLLAVDLVLPEVTLPAGLSSPFAHAVDLALIAAGAWCLIRAINVLATRVTASSDPALGLDSRTRRLQTQSLIIRRILVVLIVVVAVSLMLLTFDKVRAVGASLLASAGIAALAAGIAVRPLLTNLLAGIQIALTQPLEIDDVVIVEGEWGFVEEITFTYVVVRTWDLRRLIVPISVFTEKAFQNWTRGSPDLLGAVALHVDHTTPVPALREELQRILKGNPSWDGKVSALQVTDATPRTLEVRAILSAPNADALGNLRAEVRERLIDFLQQRYPGSLPRLRADLETHTADATVPSATPDSADSRRADSRSA